MKNIWTVLTKYLLSELRSLYVTWSYLKTSSSYIVTDYLKIALSGQETLSELRSLCDLIWLKVFGYLALALTISIS